MKGARMSRIDISLPALKEVVADLGQVFTTKEVCDDIRTKQANPRDKDHRNYRSFVGGALSDHRAQLKIDEIRKNTPRGSEWKKI
jgi:hypothetical protein